MITPSLAGIAGENYDVCVIGAGPVGISLALELSQKGRRVLLLESGGTAPDPQAQSLADAELEGPHHVPMSLAVQRRLGGTSNLWGGRCLPLDPIDFEPRSFAHAPGWPVSAEEVLSYIPQACAYAGCGDPVFSFPAPRPVTDSRFTLDRLERWSTRPRFRKFYHKTLRNNPSIDLRLHATVNGLDVGTDGRVRHIRIVGAGGEHAQAHARAVVLACGGLECTRLLLACQEQAGAFLGGESGALGRYYMGHVYGAVAEITVNDSWLDAGMDYLDDGHGSYVRRRFNASVALQRQEGLANASLWPEFPPIFNPDHGSSVLSFAYLALSLPPVGRMVVAESVRRAYLGRTPIRRWPHLLNVLRDLPRTSVFVPSFIYRRYLAPRIRPGFFERNRARRYALRYHAEHLPHPDSRITLAETCDATGLRRVRARMLYAQADAEALLRTHAHFESWFTQARLGKMVWSVPAEERVAHILAQCCDGHHQIGTTRMAESAASGVVDRDLQVFGCANLFVASSSVFPTSGQANPTLTAIALGLRLAGHLDRHLSNVEAA